MHLSAYQDNQGLWHGTYMVIRNLPNGQISCNSVYSDKICQYPDLYASSKIEESKLRIFDQLFNVNGNGIRNNIELIKQVKLPKKVYTEERALRLISNSSYIGYTKTRTICDNIIMGLQGSEVNRGDPIFEEEKNNFPEAIFWDKCGRMDYEWNPYPNFKKNYSIVYEAKNFNNLGRDWIKTALWFYEQCLIYFNTKADDKYHYAVKKGQVEEFKKIRSKYKSDASFSKAYETELINGDFEDFLNRRWAKEKKRCIDFINETIVLLKGWNNE